MTDLYPMRPPAGSWVEQRACVGAPVEWFYPPDGVAPTKGKELCAGCPVKAECLAYAIENREEYGVWGGVSPRDRRRMFRGVRLRPEVAACGTTGGYRAHRRKGESPCADCREANAAYKRAYQERETEDQRQRRLERRREQDRRRRPGVAA